MERLTPDQALARLADDAYDESTIKEVSRHKGNFSITLENRTGFGFKAEYLGKMKQPEVGDLCRVYARWGDRIRGVDLRGEPVFYKTQVELDGEHEQWKVDYKERKRKDFEKNRRKLDRQFAALPDVFQRRVSWFRANDPNFRVDHEAYELSVCTDAVKIAEAMKTVKGVQRFAKMSYERQRKTVPDLYDGHSGNSFDCAVRLARLYLENPIFVIAEHGALTPLVGCEEYGCAHPRPLDVEEALDALRSEAA